MVVLLWILQKLSPIIVIVGGIYFCFECAYVDVWLYIVAGISAIIGGIFGATSWGNTVPPRWFWSKSTLELFDNKVSEIFGWAGVFFLIPFFVCGIVELFG